MLSFAIQGFSDCFSLLGEENYINDVKKVSVETSIDPIQLLIDELVEARNDASIFTGEKLTNCNILLTASQTKQGKPVMYSFGIQREKEATYVYYQGALSGL